MFRCDTRFVIKDEINDALNTCKQCEGHWKNHLCIAGQWVRVLKNDPLVIKTHVLVFCILWNVCVSLWGIVGVIVCCLCVAFKY